MRNLVLRQERPQRPRPSLRACGRFENVPDPGPHRHGGWEPKRTRSKSDTLLDGSLVDASPQGLAGCRMHSALAHRAHGDTELDQGLSLLIQRSGQCTFARQIPGLCQLGESGLELVIRLWRILVAGHFDLRLDSKLIERR